ncbi:hypothetical protein SELMODRAFT_432435 [Selaginella moellendorffii]|uniref:ATPase domain-containing protein n=1 Tax=Selaginella moellendorffii TaxID=88036 RepID=D8TFZ9_SELML|nr:hypothetical protein SELMODRAFT_432435 [Selaginella moellendorffii]
MAMLRAGRLCRRFSSLSKASLDVDGVFMNRCELAKLQRALSKRPGDAGVVAALQGPKSSGKTMLISEFCRRQREGMFAGTSTYVSLRHPGLTDPGRLATGLMGGFLKSVSSFRAVDTGKDVVGQWAMEVGLKDEDLETHPFGYGHFRLFEEPEPTGMVAVLDALRRCFLSWMKILRLEGGLYTKGFPTIFIDEASALMSWTETADGRAAMNLLFRCLLAMSQEDCSTNVVLGSSESFFERWLGNCTPVGGHRVAEWYVGHFPEPLAKAYFMRRVGEAKQAEVAPLWDGVYRLYGGQALELNLLAGLICDSEPGEAAEVFRGEAGLSTSSAVSDVVSGWSPRRLERFDGRSDALWKPEEWTEVIRVCAKAPDGVVPKCELKIAQESVDSMIEHDRLQVQPVISWAESRTDQDLDSYPLVMPMTKAEHHGMKRLARQLS